MARPTKLDDLMTQKILNAVRKGMARREVAAIAGVAESTLFLWLQNNSEFSDRVRAAEAEGEMALVGKIEDAAERSWQAAAWLLSRRNPERWAERKQEVPLTEQEAEAILEEVAKLKAGS